MNLYFLNLIHESNFRERKRNRALIFDCEPVYNPSILNRFPAYKTGDLVKGWYTDWYYREVDFKVDLHIGYYVTKDKVPYYWEEIGRYIFNFLDPNFFRFILKNKDKKIKIGKNRYHVHLNKSAQTHGGSFITIIKKGTSHITMIQ